MNTDKLNKAIENCLSGDDYSHIEFEHGKEGRKVVHLFIKMTVYYFLAYFIIAVIWLLLSNCFQLPYILIFSILTGLFILIPPILKMFSAKNSKVIEMFFSHVNTGKLSLREFLYVRLISFKTLWLWVLMIGFWRSLYKADFKIFDADHLSTFAISFSESLILVILSYIASNILSEILSVREDYTKHQKFFDSITQQLPSLTDTVNAINDARTPIVNAINYTVWNNDIESLKTHIDTNDVYRNKTPFKESLNSYISTIQRYYKVLEEKFTTHEYIDSWLVYALKAISENEINSFKKTDTTITDFSIFGKLISDCLKETKKFAEPNKIEIYTTIVLTPLEFVDYSKTFDNSDISDNEKKQKMGEWKQFLETNRKYVSDDTVTIKRHFIIIPDDGKVQNSPELAKLNKDNIVQGLNKTYQIDGNKELIFDENNNPIENESGMSVKDLVSSVYHKDKNVFMMTIDQNLFLQEEELKKMLFHKSNNGLKPADLFCIAIKNSNGSIDWKLCLNAICERDFNMARITILHESTSSTEWEKYKANLSKIFINDNRDKGIIITEFNKFN